jgi:prepilin-type N-terminal cleavage/methylation domain-containing protein
MIAINRKRASSHSGFTLIELLVVIAIIALMSAVIFASLSAARAKARDANRIATAKSLKTALALYEDKYGTVIGINGLSASASGTAILVASGTNSIADVLVNEGFLSRKIAGDTVFGTSEYFLGVAPDGKYDVYAKLERPESAMSSSTLSNGSDGSSAVAAGYNYASGFGGGVGQGGGGVVASEGGGGGGGPIATTTINLTATPSSVVGGQAFTLNWSSTNATTTCVSSGSWSGARANSGSAGGSGLSSTSTFTLYCANATAGGAGATTSVIVGYSAPPTGGALYKTPGIYTFTVPAGVTSVSVLAVGAGATSVPGGSGKGGAGGALAYVNNISVTPGSTISVRVAGPGVSSSYFGSSTEAGSASGMTPGAVILGTGGAGGATSAANSWTGGGGAGGYSSSGGSPGYGYSVNPTQSTSGGGAGGGSMFINNSGGGGGGGTGVYGQGANGAIAAMPGPWGSAYGYAASAGGGGSSGDNGTTGGQGYGGNGGNGGWPGGGGGAPEYDQSSGTYPGSVGVGAGGAVRIIWPGSSRSFPSTSVTAVSETQI